MEKSKQELQIERIMHYEAILTEAAAVLRNLDQALAAFRQLQPGVRELEAYYNSPVWRQDFEDDEQGLLPKDLKRGVLSEDGIYDILTANREYVEKNEQREDQPMAAPLPGNPV